jgi:hypothetical protein
MAAAILFSLIIFLMTFTLNYLFFFFHLRCFLRRSRDDSEEEDEDEVCEELDGSEEEYFLCLRFLCFFDSSCCDRAECFDYACLRLASWLTMNLGASTVCFWNRS